MLNYAPQFDIFKGIEAAMPWYIRSVNSLRDI